MRQLETSTLSNQNISSYLLVHTYTADADRAVFARIHLDQVAGNGDYSIYATIQAAGAGSAYMVGPITTFTVPSGTTAIGFVSILVPVNNTDVVKFYVKGLAGDTTTPDIMTRIFELTYLRPTVNGRTLDVASTGEAGVDFDNIHAAANPTTLTNITVPVVTTVTGLDASKLDVAVSTRNATTPPTVGQIDTQLSNTHGSGLWGGEAGTGAISWPIMVDDGTNPLDGVDVWITTDEAGLNVVARGYTDTLGVVTFQLDAGNYYLWKQLAGWTFTNPEDITVS